MSFTRGKLTVLYTLNNLQVGNEFKYPCVIFSSGLKWNSYIQLITEKANRRLRLMVRVVKNAPQSTSEVMYVTFVRPILEYASVIWDASASRYINTTEKVQTDPARSVSSCYGFVENVTEMKATLWWDLLVLGER